MKIKACCGVGLIGHRESILDIPDDELEDMSEDERDEYT